MAPLATPLDDTAHTSDTIDQALESAPDRPMLFGGTGSGKSRPMFLPAVEAMLGNAVLRAALEDLRSDRNRLASAYGVLLTAAQAAVIEAHTSRRNPITPILEALTDLDDLPANGARLHELMPETAAAWPTGPIG